MQTKSREMRLKIGHGCLVFPSCPEKPRKRLHNFGLCKAAATVAHLPGTHTFAGT
jgi:hypothetical protein